MDMEMAADHGPRPSLPGIQNNGQIQQAPFELQQDDIDSDGEADRDTLLSPDKQKQHWQPHQHQQQKQMCAVRLVSRERDGHQHISQKFWFLAADPYGSLMEVRWWKLLAGFTVYYFFWHVIFAAIFMFDADGITNATNNVSVGRFMDCFFFSVQTAETIGFGLMSPTSRFSNTIVVFESYLNLVTTAVVTGFVFAKISRPSRMRRHTLFSKVAVVNRSATFYSGGADLLDEGEYVRNDPTLPLTQQVPVLQLRFVNTKKSMLVESEVRLILLRKETPSGIPWGNPSADPSEFNQRPVYKLHELDFEINSQMGRVRGAGLSMPVLALPYELSHAMDSTSPLHGASRQSLELCEAEIIVVYDGIDEATSNNVQSRWSYLASELRLGCVFRQVVTKREKTKGRWGIREGGGGYEIDFDNFHTVVPE
eukprot:TRINITY_DN11316_c0_g1_i1.p1 TRINITY_DN11316_c0_g1~~TRINITY_DN11316_c0_g1_i1.p1  ORF type:complete len:424 (+),score=70.09 TRINITY_DN11316_c0_g1_i1:288-1559(+)